MFKKSVKLEKVISGGQTGVDQGGLAAAQECGIPTGGWAPRNWLTEAGSKPQILRDAYGLKEIDGGYRKRTEANVRDSDGTIVLAYNFNTSGTKCTLKALRWERKPYFEVDLNNPPTFQEIVCWIREHNIKVLNIAGNRQTKDRDAFGTTKSYLMNLFSLLKKEKLV